MEEIMLVELFVYASSLIPVFCHFCHLLTSRYFPFNELHAACEVQVTILNIKFMHIFFIRAFDYVSAIIIKFHFPMMIDE